MRSVKVLSAVDSVKQPLWKFMQMQKMSSSVPGQKGKSELKTEIPWTSRRGGGITRGKDDTLVLIKIFIVFFSELKLIEHIRNLGAYLSCLMSYQAQPLFVQELWEEILGRSEPRVMVLTLPS